MLSREQLIKSCQENHLTSLLCAQGYEATEEDVLNDNPELAEDDDTAVYPSQENQKERDLKEAVMIRMLQENLDFGPLMETDDENVWQQLKEEFNIQGDEGTVSWLGNSDNPAVRTQWTGIPVMRVIASLDKHTIGIYRIDNEMQYDAIVDYQLEKTKKGIK